MRSAVRKLCQQGIEALVPQKVNGRWRKAAVSSRVAADLRKLAIRTGTYGKFDSETGVGWDPLWDAPKVNLAAASEMAQGKIIGSNKGGIQSIRPPKGTKRERTRESRAQKIESLVAQADEKIEEYRLEMESKKPEKGIENEFKRAMKSSRY